MTTKLPMMIPVVSSNIASIGYEPADRYLFTKFKNGGVYRSEDVAPQVFEDFKAAESAGKFFAAEIRGQYQTTKLDVEVQDGMGA